MVAVRSTARRRSSPATLPSSAATPAQRGAGRRLRPRLEFDRRQILHLLLGQPDPDLPADAGRGTNRDRHLLASPQMTLPQQDVRDVMILGFDHKALNRADPAIGGMHRIAAVHLHLAERDAVNGIAS